jgi:hypothetical protein
VTLDTNVEASAPGSRPWSVDLLEHLQQMHKLVSRDRSTRLPRLLPDEETQHSSASRLTTTLRRPRGWLRWLLGAAFKLTHPEPTPAATEAEPPSVHATLCALPTLLDSSGLPDGVVELLVEDLETPTRHLFDIHDGHLTLVEPGRFVPWACIAGSSAAWALALGPTRDTASLELTGDTRLARCLLAALPREG